MQPQIRTFDQQVSSATIWRLFSPEDSETVHLNMSEQGNGQFPLAKRTVRNRDSSGLWEQIKTAYASGIGLREIARNMDIPEGTVLARAKREGWSKQISDAKSLAKRDDTALAVTPMAIKSGEPFAARRRKGFPIAGALQHGRTMAND